MTNFSSTPGFEPTVTWLQTTSMLADILGLNGSNVDLPLLGRNRVNSSMEGFEPLVSWVQTATASMITDHNEEPAEDFIKYIYPVRRVLRKKFWHGFHPHRYVTTDRYRHLCSVPCTSSFFSHVSLFIRPSYFLLFLLPFLFCVFVFYFFFSSFSTVFKPTSSSLEKIKKNGEVQEY